MTISTRNQRKMLPYVDMLRREVRQLPGRVPASVTYDVISPFDACIVIFIDGHRQECVVWKRTPAENVEIVEMRTTSQTRCRGLEMGDNPSILFHEQTRNHFPVTVFWQSNTGTPVC